MFLGFVFVNFINMFGTSYFNSWVTVTGSLIFFFFFLCCAADPESVSRSPYFFPPNMEPVTGILLTGQIWNAAFSECFMGAKIYIFYSSYILWQVLILKGAILILLTWKSRCCLLHLVFSYTCQCGGLLLQTDPKSTVCREGNMGTAEQSLNFQNKIFAQRLLIKVVKDLLV